MASQTFFFQDSIYQGKKTKSHREFLKIKKNATQVNRLEISAYINSLDPSLFDDSITIKRKTHITLNKKYISIFRYFLIIFFVFLASFITINFLYKLIQNNSSFLNNIRFEKDEKVEKFLSDIAMPQSEAKEISNISLPETIKEVKYTEYIVKNGDTIGGIAYKMGLRKIGTIFSVNNITNARRIMTGTKLLIPSMDGIIYVVKQGDSLEKIGKQFNIAIEHLLDANDISDGSLEIGKRLFIPGASLSRSELQRAMGELFIYPIKGRLTSPFGYRKDPFTGRKSFHSGIDLAAPTGTPIKVVLDGTVSEISSSRIFGNYMIVTHSNGYQTLYGHLSKFKARRGQKVVQGEIIAFVGNTGMSTGPHVHLSIYKHGKLIDPLSVLK